MAYFATTQILDGKQTAEAVLHTLQAEVAGLQQPQLAPPKLVVVLVGDDPASQIYVQKKAQTARRLGMLSDVVRLPATASQEEIHAEIYRLNEDAFVHGILVQLPLPAHIDTLAVINRVSPDKDVDGLHPLNMGRLLVGDPAACKPCTPAGIMALLKAYKVPIAGKQAVVLGRSNIVGKPMGLLLLQENATVTYGHRQTQHLADVLRKADILVAAVGVPHLIQPEHVKPGAVVVDVGINRVDGQLVGDVNFEAVAPQTAYITPVPGGVGPMTIATLMANTVHQYRRALARAALPGSA